MCFEHAEQAMLYALNREYIADLTDNTINLNDWYIFIDDDNSVDNGQGSMIMNLNILSPDYQKIISYTSSDEGICSKIANSFTEFIKKSIDHSEIIIHNKSICDCFNDNFEYGSSIEESGSESE